MANQSTDIDSIIDAQKKSAAESDRKRRESIMAMSEEEQGVVPKAKPPYTGETLKTFQKTRKKSSLLQRMFNEDGTPKAGSTLESDLVIEKIGKE